MQKAFGKKAPIDWGEDVAMNHQMVMIYGIVGSPAQQATPVRVVEGSAGGGNVNVVDTEPVQQAIGDLTQTMQRGFQTVVEAIELLTTRIGAEGDPSLSNLLEQLTQLQESLADRIGQADDPTLNDRLAAITDQLEEVVGTLDGTLVTTNGQTVADEMQALVLAVGHLGPGSEAIHDIARIMKIDVDQLQRELRQAQRRAQRQDRSTAKGSVKNALTAGFITWRMERLQAQWLKLHARYEETTDKQGDDAQRLLERMNGISATGRLLENLLQRLSNSPNP
jgi:hypothetical protein